MSQMSLDFSAPKLKDSVEVPKPVNSIAYLQSRVDTAEPLIYLYGQNLKTCMIRTHSSDDIGIIYPIMRKEAESILHEWYDLHSLHTSHDGKKGKVYHRREKPRKV